MQNDLRIIASLFLDQAKALWPFYLAGIVFAAVIKTLMWDRRIRASLVHHERASIFVATCAGLVSPLCSCGILPVVIALSAAGVPLPPVLALLITSPLMGPDAFLITVGQLGWTYALWKMGIAAVVGLATGFAALSLSRRGILRGTSFKVERMYGEGGAVRPGFEEIVKAGCFSHAGEPGGVVDRENRGLFFLERLRDMGLLVGKFLAAALLLQAVITYYVPANAVEPFLGRKSALSVLFATLIAIPLPLSQVVAPSVIKGFLSAGMSPGAAMAMLVGGPVTSIPALSVLLGVYDRRAFALYLGIGVTAAFTAGTLFQSFYG
ncbi:MAG: permease [Deltaproteobacteria bacterium]|nr:permease [Deltaproteobacteria bacterium]